MVCSGAETSLWLLLLRLKLVRYIVTLGVFYLSWIDAVGTETQHNTIPLMPERMDGANSSPGKTSQEDEKQRDPAIVLSIHTSDRVQDAKCCMSKVQEQNKREQTANGGAVTHVSI